MGVGEHGEKISLVLCVYYCCALSAVFLGLFDGHMGSQASAFCAKQLPIELAKELAQLPSHVFQKEAVSSPSSPLSLVLPAEPGSTAEANAASEISPKTKRVKRCETVVDGHTVGKGSAASDAVEKSTECSGKRQRMSSEPLQAEPESVSSLEPVILRNGVNERDQEDCDARGGSANSTNTTASGPSTAEESDTSVLKVTPLVESESLDIQQVVNAISRAFFLTDQQFLERHRLNKDGSTVSMVLLLGKHLFCAWLGDSRVVLGSLRRVCFTEPEAAIKDALLLPSFSVGDTVTERPGKTNAIISGHPSCSGVTWVRGVTV